MPEYKNFSDSELPASVLPVHDKLVASALDLFAAMGLTSYLVPIPRTTPTVYVVAGEIKDIDLLLSGVRKP